MAWRGLHLSRPARLSLADHQLVVVQERDELRLALEDLAWIILDTSQVSLTASLLSACMQAGIVLITCDDRHTPSGLTLPFHTHHRQAAVSSAQARASLPLRKRLWQTIVKAKIENQAAVLDRRDASSGLRAMARHVASGDPDNIEARAARFYWSRIFRDFTRDNGTDGRNGLLNYGYAVLRAGVARALVAYGLLPCFGLQHRSETNAFNLADDIVEPFRPFVDRLVVEISSSSGASVEVSLPHRQRLAAVLTLDALTTAGVTSLLTATERAAMTLVQSLETGSAAVLDLPRLSQ